MGPRSRSCARVHAPGVRDSVVHECVPACVEREGMRECGRHSFHSASGVRMACVCVCAYTFMHSARRCVRGVLLHVTQAYYDRVCGLSHWPSEHKICIDR